MSARIKVEVVYALPLVQDCTVVELAPAATAAEAIERSGVLERHPEIEAAKLRAGVWGRRIRLDQPLADGDRVEIYRPLQVHPMDVRRRRAAGGRTRGR